MDTLTPQPQPVTPNHNPLYTIIFVLVAVAAIAAVWYYIAGDQTTEITTSQSDVTTTTPTTTAGSSSSSINSNADLQTNQDELEAIDMTPIETTLNENDSDASTF